MCLILVLLIMIALFRLYPEQPRDSSNYLQDFEETNAQVMMEEVVRTRQSSRPAPPVQRNLPPKPKDEYIEMEPLDFTSFEPLNENLEPIERPGSGGEEDYEPVANPDIPPQVRKIVEPVVPKEARQADIKARIRVSFLVSPKGKVEDMSITHIEVYDKEKGKFVEKERIGYGLAEATLLAAGKWKFGPAEKGGSKVPALTEHEFTYGFD